MVTNPLKIILLIEDNFDDYEATERSFRKAKLQNELAWCSSAERGIEFLREGKPSDNDVGSERPGMILLDLNMPGMGGRKFLELLKADESLKGIPTIVLTTSVDDRDIDTCYKLGASTYIQKPVGFRGLVEAATSIKDYWFGTAILPHCETAR